MKTLLICPQARSAVPALAALGPLALAPVLGQPLIGAWLEHLAALGARDVTVIAPDRPAAVRAAVGTGSRWGLRIELVEASSEPERTEAAAIHRGVATEGWLPSPWDIVTLDRLPGAPNRPLFGSHADWFSALVAWMPQALTPARVRVIEQRPGVWVGRRAQVAASARLEPPCWIGDLTYVGPDAVVGPHAVLEDRSVVERGARVVRSMIAPDTFVGRMTSISDSLACGSILANWRTGSVLRVPDPFLLCSLARTPPPRKSVAAVANGRAPLLSRAAGALAYFSAWWARLDAPYRSLKPPA